MDNVNFLRDMKDLNFIHKLRPNVIGKVLEIRCKGYGLILMLTM